MTEYLLDKNSYCVLYSDEAKNVFAFPAFGWPGQTLATDKEVNFYYTLESYNIEMVRLGQPELPEDEDPFKEE